MSRLIDADALIEELHHMIDGDADLRKNYEYMGIDDYIRSMPTAYDPEADVEKLEKEYNNIPFQYELNYEDGFSDGLLKAIEIVRKGGV